MDKFLIKKGTKRSGDTSNVSESTTKRSATEPVMREKSPNLINLKKKNPAPVSSTSIDENANSASFSITKRPKLFSKWQTQYSWLTLNLDARAICSICVKAVEKKLILPNDSRAGPSREAFVDFGFTCWKNATIAFRKHEVSELHRCAVQGLASLENKTVAQQLSLSKSKEMVDARVALLKIFTTINTLARQGLALRRDNNDEQSNLVQFLKMRAEDVPQLKLWLKRTAYKWIHHDSVNEILQIMANAVIAKLLIEIKSADYYSLIIHETSDVSRLEQISVSIRIVLDDFSVNETFLGFYGTDSTKSETLFKIVIDVLTRFSLDIHNLRGQCYDGASNVSGRMTGLQARIREVEPRALYVHCAAHRLNLVVQDTLENIPCVKDFIGVVKDLINLIRDSPKRLAMYKSLQSEGSPLLSPFCPTRWCMRVKSLKTLHDKGNYGTTLQFLEEMRDNPAFDASATAKANGFIRRLEEFEFFLLLTMLIDVFERVEILNTALQKVDLHVNESHEKVTAVIQSLIGLRETGFDSLWCKAITEAQNLQLNEPKVPRVRKAPKKLESTSTKHSFSDPKDYYRKLYFEIIDRTVNSMNDRFASETLKLLNQMEDFMIGKGTVEAEEICSFYGATANNSQSESESDFNVDQLELHRAMFLDIANQRGIKLTSLKDVLKFLKENPSIASIIPQVTKLVKMALTIPVSSCTAERSFSALRRLKNYLRSSMLQRRLNAIAILHVHAEDAEAVDIDALMNEFISKCNVRRNTFAMCNGN